MEIVERMENKLLNRVEIKFSWRHSGKATPFAVRLWIWLKH